MNFKEKLFKLINEKQYLLFLLGIISVGVFWRVYKLNSIPVGLNSFEHANILDSLNFLQNIKNLDLFDMTHSLYFGIFFVISKITVNITFLRVFQILLGILYVILFYYFLKEWFNRQTALLGSLLLSTSFFHLILSRNLQFEILIPIFTLAIILLSTNALKYNKWYLYFITGIVSGLSLYVSELFIITPILGILFFLYLYFKNNEILSEKRFNLLILFSTFLIISIPYVYFISMNLIQFIQIFNPYSIGGFFLNLGNNILTMFYQSPINNLYNVGTEPLFDPFVTISFLCGLIYAVFYLYRRKFLILVAYFAVSLIFISLKSKQNILDLSLLLPIIFSFSAIMLDYVLTHWVRTFPYNKAARLLMTFVFSLFLFLSIFYNYQKYFWAWGKNQSIQENYHYKIEYQQK